MTDPAQYAPQQPQLRCPLCGCPNFQREQAREDSMWGFSTHTMRLMICMNCSHVLHFYGSRSIFDFD